MWRWLNKISYCQSVFLVLVIIISAPLISYFNSRAVTRWIREFDGVLETTLVILSTPLVILSMIGKAYIDYAIMIPGFSMLFTLWWFCEHIWNHGHRDTDLYQMPVWLVRGAKVFTQDDINKYIQQTQRRNGDSLLDKEASNQRAIQLHDDLNDFYTWLS